MNMLKAVRSLTATPCSEPVITDAPSLANEASNAWLMLAALNAASMMENRPSALASSSRVCVCVRARVEVEVCVGRCVYGGVEVWTRHEMPLRFVQGCVHECARK